MRVVVEEVSEGFPPENSLMLAGCLDSYLCNPKNPNDAHVFTYLRANLKINPNYNFSASMMHFLNLCALSRYFMREISDEIEEGFKEFFAEQEEMEPPFFILKDKKIYEYDLEKKVYVNPLNASDFLCLDPKGSDTEASESSDTASSESSTPFAISSRSPSPVVDPAQNSNNGTLSRKNSGPSLFSQVSPRSVREVEGAPTPQAIIYLNFQDQRDIIYHALRSMLSDVKDIDNWLVNHVKNATNKEVLLWHIEHRISNPASSQPVIDALTQAREILLRPTPNLIELLQNKAVHGKCLPPPPNKIPPRQAPQASPAVVERASFKILLINAVMWFLDHIAKFLSRIQCAPISPFCAHRFAC